MANRLKVNCEGFFTILKGNVFIPEFEFDAPFSEAFHIRSFPFRDVV